MSRKLKKKNPLSWEAPSPSLWAASYARILETVTQGSEPRETYKIQVGRIVSAGVRAKREDANGRGRSVHKLRSRDQSLWGLQAPPGNRRIKAERCKNPVASGSFKER